MKQSGPNICMGSRTLLEYREACDGNWMSNKIIKQMGIAVKIGEAKYPKEKSYRLFWIFDQSGCHMAYADDSLNVYRINIKEGGSKPLMHDTIYNGRHISMSKVVNKSHSRETFYTLLNDQCIANNKLIMFQHISIMVNE